MATPLLSLIEKLFARESRARSGRRFSRYPRILISFANPESGPVFLKLVNLLYGRMIGGALKVTAVRCTIGTDPSPLNAYDYSKGSFAPLRAEADRLGLRIDTRYRVTDRYVEDLRSLAMREHYDFVLTRSGAQLHPQLSRTGAPHAACRGRVPCRRTVAPAQLALPRGAFAR